jgi:hypothetical protein
MLRAYLDKGYAVASYSVAPGTYVYYAGNSVPALKDLEAARILAEQGNVALAMPLADAQSWSDKPECLREAHRQWLGTQVYVVLACPLIEGLAPAQDPFGEPFDIVEEAKMLLRGFGIPVPKVRQAVQPASLAPEPVPQPLPQPLEDKPAGDAVPLPAVQEPTPETPAPEAPPEETQPTLDAHPYAHGETPDAGSDKQQDEQQLEDSAHPEEEEDITT